MQIRIVHYQAFHRGGFIQCLVCRDESRPIAKRPALGVDLNCGRQLQGVIGSQRVSFSQIRSTTQQSAGDIQVCKEGPKLLADQTACLGQVANRHTSN